MEKKPAIRTKKSPVKNTKKTKTQLAPILEADESEVNEWHSNNLPRRVPGTTKLFDEGSEE